MAASQQVSAERRASRDEGRLALRNCPPTAEGVVGPWPSTPSTLDARRLRLQLQLHRLHHAGEGSTSRPVRLHSHVSQADRRARNASDQCGGTRQADASSKHGIGRMDPRWPDHAGPPQRNLACLVCPNRDAALTLAVAG